MPERDIRRALKERVTAYGGEVRAVSWLGRRHAPDVLCLFSETHRKDPAWPDSGMIWVEAKAPTGRASAGQLREHERLKQCGATVLVISTLEQLDNWLPPL